jgi:hypothetical protein
MPFREKNKDFFLGFLFPPASERRINFGAYVGKPTKMITRESAPWSQGWIYALSEKEGQRTKRPLEEGNAKRIPPPS